MGDDPVEGLEQFARDHGVTGAQFTGVGALSRAVIGYSTGSGKTTRE
jgi:predicted DNA-binding protein with PD1-like motif